MAVKYEKLELGSGYYTITDIANILKVDRHKISYLVRNYWNDRLSAIQDFQYLYDLDGTLAVNFFALIEINIFYILKENGISYQKALNAHSFFSKKFATRYPFAHNSFYISGSDILFQTNESFVIADESKQIAITEMIEPFSKKIDYSENNIASVYYPLGRDKDVIVDPKHQFGEPVIKETNILAKTVVQMHNSGDSIKLISKLYSIKESSIKDALAFFSKAA